MVEADRLCPLLCHPVEPEMVAGSKFQSEPVAGLRVWLRSARLALTHPTKRCFQERSARLAPSVEHRRQAVARGVGVQSRFHRENQLLHT